MIKCQACKNLRPIRVTACPYCGSTALSPADVSFMLTVAASDISHARYISATEIYRRLAALGIAEAEREYGLMLIKGRLLPKNKEAGIRLLTSSAEKGDAVALFKLAPLVPNERLASFLIRLSAALGNKDALIEAAKLYLAEGDEQAAEYCLLSAPDEIDGAALLLAELYISRNALALAAGVIKSAEPKRGRRKYRKMQRLVRNTEPVFQKPDHSVGHRLILKLREQANASGFRVGYFLLTEILAQAGSADEAFRLAMLCAEGDGCPRDGERAVKLLREAALRDHPDAAEALAELEAAEGNGEAAVTLYIKAAEAGKAACYGKAAELLAKSEPARALELFSLGARRGEDSCRKRRDLLIAEREMLYRLGKSAATDEPSKAREYLERSAELGYAPSYTELARLYEARGDHGSRKRCFELFILAKEKGDDSCYAEIGRCYAEGIGIARNSDKAVRYLSIAARLGDERAQSELAQLEDRIRRRRARKLLSAGVRHVHARRFKEARAALFESARLGCVKASYTLGCLSEFGRGCPCNREAAREYYSIARGRGFKDADGRYKRRILSMSR